jgi:4-amino-4-deoxy-L-arabinose transferase-like glycosyltransferase
MFGWLNRHRLLTAVFVCGLAVRVSILWSTADLGPKNSDELHYIELATSLLAGRGFAWESGERTSLRPPLYPAFVAGIWSVAGAGNLLAVRLVQTALALLTAILAFDLGRRLWGSSVGAVAASAMWLYPTLIFLSVTILTETLFTTLLLAFLLLSVILLDRPRPATALACGLVLGLGALTRSVLWPLPLVVCPMFGLLVRGTRAQRMLVPAIFLAGYALVVVPWSVRNTQLQGVFTVVDTMGGLNLRMCNYEHTPEDRMWDAVSLTGERSWVYAFTQEAHPQPVTEGMKDRWAQRMAVQYIADHPGTTARRALIKFADFWGLERTYIAGVQEGLYTPPVWFAAAAIVAITASWIALALLGGAGIWLTAPAARAHLVLLLPVLAIAAAHTATFGHPRYHVPLVPILALYAAGIWQAGPVRTFLATRPAVYGAALTVAALLAIWIRQVLVEAERLRALLHLP